FYNHFFLGDGNIDHDGCLKILNEVVNRIKDSLLDEDFYFPILANGLEKDEINLGIASIIPKENIFSDIQPNFTTDVIELAEEFCNSQLHPYKHFLKITIKNCSKERRKYLSKQIANFIVGIIQLFSEHFQIDSDVVALSLNPYPNYESFYITNNDDGYNYCFSSKGTIVHSAVFWQKFKQENASELGSIIKQIIIHATTPKSNPVLVDRLIDAIFIFRSAMQDNDDSSKIVKLTTALERLVNTQKDNITSTFISRVTLLLNMYHKDNSDWSSIAKEMYNYRSEIVHGSWSLYRQTKPLYAGRYSELTSKALISACIGFFHVGLKREDDIKLINSFYDYLSKNNQS
ncbi:HEPN domain-containing protein, partial [Enterobacter hormaechei]